MLTIWNYSYNWVLFHNLLYPFFFQMEIFQDLETFLINQVYYGERDVQDYLTRSSVPIRYCSNSQAIELMEKASDPHHVDPIPQCADRHTPLSFFVVIGWVRIYTCNRYRSYRFGFYLFQKSYLPGLPIITILTYA